MRLLKGVFGAGAFTLIELLCVIAVIGTLAALLLPSLSRGNSAARRIQCVNQLRQAGLAFNAFAHDHNSSFPMGVSRSLGGSLEFVQNAYRVDGDFYFGFRHFQTLSNHLVTPKPLTCPHDTRLPAENFEDLKNENVSYFVGLGATPGRPMSVLAGDRNISMAGKNETLVKMGQGEYLRWDGTIHQFRGNLLFADGHVEQRHNFEFTPPQVPGGAASTELVLPSVKPSAEPNAPPASGPFKGDSAAPRNGTQPYGAVREDSSETNRPGLASRSIKRDAPEQFGGNGEKREAVRTVRQAGETNVSARGMEPSVAPRPTEPQPSWFQALLAEVMEPLVREMGLVLYLLLLVVVCASLVIRRWLTRDRSPGQAGTVE